MVEVEVPVGVVVIVVSSPQLISKETLTSKTNKMKSDLFIFPLLLSVFY